MFKEMKEVIEGSREDYRAIPIENVENGARESEVGGLNHLSTPELEDGFDGEYNLEEGKGFGRWVVLKDVFTSNGKERNELRSVG